MHNIPLSSSMAVRDWKALVESTFKQSEFWRTCSSSLLSKYYNSLASRTYYKRHVHHTPNQGRLTSALLVRYQESFTLTAFRRSPDAECLTVGRLKHTSSWMSMGQGLRVPSKVWSICRENPCRGRWNQYSVQTAVWTKRNTTPNLTCLTRPASTSGQMWWAGSTPNKVYEPNCLFTPRVALLSVWEHLP